jgi:hypothetical protein
MAAEPTVTTSAEPPSVKGSFESDSHVSVSGGIGFAEVGFR